MSWPDRDDVRTLIRDVIEAHAPSGSEAVDRALDRLLDTIEWERQSYWCPACREVLTGNEIVNEECCLDDICPYCYGSVEPGTGPEDDEDDEDAEDEDRAID